ncbi:DNA-binding protein [Pseudoduganella sp. FT26W]|uniref:DNA-binding protein n=1 Tax=Duganella aquatilis TaxID=2666082 RepID=A0A844D6E8_9BURK|nr:excalibur calcium-binding domain-containing protein [Duganella aquatilis]MRW87668.1 DNA-binding protein [Duganella aquatilis]
MKKIILLLVIAVLAWKGYERSSPHAKAAAEVQVATREAGAADSLSTIQIDHSASFVCDGRTYCSQMKSCEEATYFLQHCPNVKMDGDNDGVPCERQWCK